MVQKHTQALIYWIIVLIAAAVVVLGYYRYQEETAFQQAGSRFTGEDAIWLLEHSNIVIDRDARIDGIETPFRSFINGGSFGVNGR